MSARVVITGAGGLVGRVLAGQAHSAGREVLTLSSAECDITDGDSVARYLTSGDVVINCAAYTQVDAAETDEARAYAVNAVGAGNVAAACARTGAALVHISTDFVFDGTGRTPYEVGDATGPVSAYGRTKLAGEHAVLAAKPDAHVVRTAWVYEGASGADFVATMRRLAGGDTAIDVVDDQVGSPTYVGDLAGALLQVAGGGVAPGILHAVNAGQASRFELACATFAAVGADPDRVRPVTSARFPRPAARPAYSVLSAHGSVAAGLIPLRDWREALADAVGNPAVAAARSTGPLPSTP